MPRSRLLKGCSSLGSFACSHCMALRIRLYVLSKSVSCVGQSWLFISWIMASSMSWFVRLVSIHIAKGRQAVSVSGSKVCPCPW